MTETKGALGKQREKFSFLSGVFWLSMSTVLVKVTGLITKIPLLHLLGAEGMGYYNTAYEIYAFLFVLSTAGLPVALSILISEERGDGGGILRLSLRLFFLLGIFGAAFLWLGAEQLARLMGNAGAAACMRAVSPAVLFICLSAAVRGYCQGLRDMKPTAISQLLEALGKMGFGILFASAARRAALPLTHVAAAGAWGLSAGTLLSLCYLLFCLCAALRREKQGSSSGISISAPTVKRPARRILKRLLALAIPITLSAGVITLTRLLDMVLILHRLRACGYTETAINVLYGAYSTLAVPLYALLPALVSALAHPLVPGIAHAREMGDSKTEGEIVGTSLALTLMLSLPASMGLAGFARPILELLFGNGEEAVEIAAPLLALLAASVPCTSLMTVTGAMLQAYHRPHLPLVSVLVGSVLKLSAAWLMLGNANIAMLGAPISTFLCSLTAILLDLVFLAPCLPHVRGLSGFCLRTLVASLLSVGGAWLLWQKFLRYLPLPRLATLGAVLLAAMLYLGLMILLGAIRLRKSPSARHGMSASVVLGDLALGQGKEKVVECYEKK